MDQSYYALSNQKRDLSILQIQLEASDYGVNIEHQMATR